MAVSKVHGYKLDKNHVFNVMPYDELARLEALPASFVVPEEEPYAPRPDLESWLSDAAGRDLFATRHAVAGREETMVAWGEPGRSPVPHYSGEREKAAGKTWCELEARWSPLGSYLVTFHRPGLALWGGPGMEKLGRFQHGNVNRLSFSPCERYMLTCNFCFPNDGASTVQFWDVASQRVLRSFPLTFSQQGEAGPEGQPPRLVPNVFKWSADGTMVAHMASANAGDNFGANGLIKVYSLPSMQLLDSKSVRAANVMDFAWSPTDNTLAYWAAEEGQSPARVVIMALPSRKELRQTNLFSVSGCEMTWHPKGDFLAVKVVRHTKSKKTFFNNLEFFRMREALVPVETLDVKTPIKSLTWEPNAGATRFALITADGPKPESKPSVSFYDMGRAEDAAAGGKKSAAAAAAAKKVELTLLKTLPDRPCSTVLWSPAGGTAVVAGLANGTGEHDYAGVFEFYDVDVLEEEGVVREHYRANAAEWDPSGRVLATSVTQPFEGLVYKFQMDNGYHMWTFQGELFFEKQWEKFYSFRCHPSPPLAAPTAPLSLQPALVSSSVLLMISNYC